MNYQDRVKHEEVELHSKIKSLNKFIDESEIFSTLDAKERSRLIGQCTAMDVYRDILVERINNFK